MTDGFLVPFPGALLGILARKTQPMQQTTYMIGMIGHPKRLCNDLRDTPTGPQRRIKASRLRALKQKLLQLILVLGGSTDSPAPDAVWL